MEKKPLLIDLINEMNNLALSLEGPEPLIKWAIITMPYLIECEFMAVALVRYDTVLLNYGSAKRTKDDLLDLFKERVEKEAQKVAGSESLIMQEANCYILDYVTKNGEGTVSSINSFYVYPLKAREEMIGCIAIASSKKDAFIKFKLNMLENFGDQLALGTKSLLDRNVIIEQTRLLEEEKKKVEEEKSKIEAIVGGMKEGLIVADKNKNIITINEAAQRFFGINKGFETKLAKKYLIDKIIGEKGKNDFYERNFILNRPERMVIRISITPIFDEAKKLLGNAILLTDITKEKQVEQMKSDFVSAVSHELRTPLTSIREAIALMVEEITGPVNDKQRRCLDVALSDVDRLTRIINDLLSLSRIESGKVKIKRLSVSVSEVVKHVADSLMPQAKKGGIEIVSDIPKELPKIFADPDQMIQVFNNLIGNALKFTSEGGQIIVTATRDEGRGTKDEGRGTKDEGRGTREEGQRTNRPSSLVLRPSVCISVADTGVGISKEDQKKLFQKFSQLDSGLTRKPGGTGLGLVIVKEIVEKHQGRIWISSDKGKGATFSFTIPIFSKESAYLDLIQQEIEKAKEVASDLALIFLNPDSKKKLSDKDKKKILVYLEEKSKEIMRRKEDIVLLYKDRYILLVVEANKDGAVKLVERVKDTAKIKFSYEIAVYPEDGVTAEELIGRVMSSE